MMLTEEQVHAVDIFRRGLTAKINAFAGTGKTTTLQYMARSRDATGIYLAFNKSIAEEAKGKFPSHVNSSTTHSYALKSLGHLDGGRNGKLGRSLNGNQLAEILAIRDIAVDSKFTAAARSVGRLVVQTVERFCRTGDQAISALHVPTYGKLFGCDEEMRNAFYARIVEFASHAWQRMQDPDDPVPLGHDNYLKLWSLSHPAIGADFVLLDEAQDSNEAVLSVLAAQQCQVIYVGDRHQQIYEWRGAVNAMARVVVEAEAHLTQSFRFGPEIADVANRILSGLGESKKLVGNPKLKSRINEGYVDAVLCRTNVGVLSVVLQELSNNRVPHVEKGVRDLLRLLKDVERLRKGVPGESDEFFGFSNWRDVEDFSRSEDGDSLKPIVSLIDKFGEDLLLEKLARVASHSAEADLTVSTAHKAKGLEWNSVQIYGDFVHKENTRKAEIRPGEEERRLLYVAATRAKESLHMPSELLDALGITGGIFPRMGERKPNPRAPALRCADRSVPSRVPGKLEGGEGIMDGAAQVIGESWESKTGSGLQNTWLEACVLAAERSRDIIVLTYIDDTGRERTIQDYGRRGLQAEVLNHLQAALPGRKIFLITYDSNRPSDAKLASDTMMLPQHRRKWT